MKQYLAVAVVFSVVSANAVTCGPRFDITNNSAKSLTLSVAMPSGSKSASWSTKPTSELPPKNTSYASILYDSTQVFKATIKAQDASKNECTVNITNDHGSTACNISISGGCTGALSYASTGSSTPYSITYK